MSASNSGPGGVRNLRAMFENRATDQSTSPPSRGRSPNGSVSSSQERPLSKVSTNFVPVEKVGEEEEQLPSPRKQSDATMDTANGKAIADEQGLGGILKGSPFLDDGEFPPPQHDSSQANGIGDRAAAMLKRMQQGNTKSPAKGDFVESGSTPSTKKPGPPRPQRKVPGESTEPPADTNKSPVETKGPVVKPKGGVAKIQGVMESAARAKEARAVAAKEEKQKEVATKPSTSKDAESSTKAARTSVAHEIRPKGGVTKIQGVMESASKAKEARQTLDATPVPKSQASKDTVKPTPAARPPRSSLPARRLPAAVTAPTASSVAKTDDSKQTEQKPVERKVSNIPPRVANATTASTLAKKSSRASLNANDGLKSKSTTRAADEGFLARMTRPTASSARKTHDKVQPQAQSPPRSKQTSGKTLTSRPSRRSLNQANENQENHRIETPTQAAQERTEDNGEPAEPQQAEVSTSA